MCYTANRGELMASDSNKKLLILYVLKILQMYSDENHPLTQEEIVKKIYSTFGMECERKSVGANIESLTDFGYNIVKLPRSGCFLAERDFEPSEVSFLADAVFSCRSIPGTKARELVEKLTKKLSIYENKKFSYIYKSNEVTRTDNKQLFYTIEIINQAIESKKKIKFKYNIYGRNGKLENRKNGKEYLVTPYYLVNSQGRYYLVCNYNWYNDISNYRLEMITDVQIVDEQAKDLASLIGGENFDIAEYVNKNIYMFSGENVSVEMKLDDDKTANYILDWFGDLARIYNRGNELFASVKANEQAIIYWALQYGKHVEIVSPEDVRSKFIIELKEIIKKYE